jgi:hypothetical protein
VSIAAPGVRTVVNCTYLLRLELSCIMESADKELFKLRTENASLRQLHSKDAQLLACKDELLATKDQLLASRTAELKRYRKLQQHTAVTSESHTVSAAGDSSKRQRLLHDSIELPLDKDEVLDLVFGFVGGGEHLYVSAVSRRWKGRYLRHCVKNKTSTLRSKTEGNFVTRYSSVLMTESRLQPALSSGLTVKDWSFSKWRGAACRYSLEPEKVITLLRAMGVPWSEELCTLAAWSGKLALLQWLHSHSCPWVEWAVLMFTCVHGSVAQLEWLMTVTAPWSFEVKNKMLRSAGVHGNLQLMQGLIAHGAVWPKSFLNDAGSVCWQLPAVQWALTQGSGWLNWQCEDYLDVVEENLDDGKFAQRATELLEWAHANGCPCTFGQVQQQQQQ